MNGVQLPMHSFRYLDERATCQLIWVGSGGNELRRVWIYPGPK